MIQRFNISMAIVCMTKSDSDGQQSGSNSTDSAAGGPEFQWDKDIQTSVLGAFYIGTD